MKYLKKILATVLVGCGALAFHTANAQETFPYGKNNVYVGYSNVDVETTENLNGLYVGYSRLFGVSATLPLFVEVGAYIQGATYSEDITIYNLNDGSVLSKTESDVQLSSLMIPVNIGYNFDLGKGFSIAPKAGLKFSWHVNGETETKTTNRVTGESVRVKYDFFDDMEGNNVGLGWQVGVNAAYKHVFLDFTYGQDFTKLFDDEDGNKIKHFSIGLGYRF